MYRNHEGYKDPTAGEAIKKYTHSNITKRSNLPFNGFLTYKLINCMSDEIKSLYGLYTRS